MRTEQQAGNSYLFLRRTTGVIMPHFYRLMTTKVRTASIELARVKYQNEDMEDYLIEGITGSRIKTAKEAFEQLSVVAADETDAKH